MNKYVIDLQLFSNKLCDVLINKKMVDKNGKPDPIKLYNLLHPNDLITDNDIEKFGRSTFTEKTRKERNWINGANYPKTMGDVLTLCNALKCDLDYFFTDMPYTTHDIQFIHDETGLSEEAIHGLQLLHFPINSVWDSVQVSRYDIIALNIILEDFYNKMKKTPDYKKFGEETDTLLNCIGQYIDASSAAIDITQNGTLKIYPSNEIVQAICRDKITLLLQELKDKYSLEIIGKRIENNERFKELYNDSVRKYLANSENEKNNGSV